MKLIINVRVKNLQRAVTFYKDVIRLACRTEKKEWAAMSIGDAEIHLYLQSGVSGHVEFYVNDIDAENKRLTEQGVKFISGMDKASAISMDDKLITTFPWGRTAFFHDSEGNELALVKDND